MHFRLKISSPVSAVASWQGIEEQAAAQKRIKMKPRYFILQDRGILSLYTIFLDIMLLIFSVLQYIYQEPVTTAAGGPSYDQPDQR